MSKANLLSDQDRERVWELKFKISNLRDQISNYEWELWNIYRQNNLTRFEIESSLKNL